MRVHFIAIGGSVMHNLAIALALKGYKVTGSDDEIFEPAKLRSREIAIARDLDPRVSRSARVIDRQSW